MKAIVHDSNGGPGVLELRDVETPVASNGSALVRVPVVHVGGKIVVTVADS